MRLPTEWNVPPITWEASRPNSVSTRVSISRAARLVKVSMRIAEAGVPSSKSRATRKTTVRVFPEPAPASTSIGPPGCSTTASCSGLSAEA